MALICPTITPASADPHEFRAQLERVAFAPRLHFDLMDGEFASPKNLNPIQLYWPQECIADIHVMYARPLEHLETLTALKPHLVIMHAEAKGDLMAAAEHLRKFSIKCGVALLQSTSVTDHAELIQVVDHILIFSGSLGHFGGQADLTLLDKVSEIKALNPQAEISWDGGVNLENAAILARRGIDVLDVGGAIQKASDPQQAYATLKQSVGA